MKTKIKFSALMLVVLMVFAVFAACNSGDADGKVGVSFNLSYAGATGAPEALRLTSGESYGTLPRAEREGYSFLGWYISRAADAEKVTAESKVKNENHVLYAKWQGDTVTVSFDLMGGKTIWDEFEIPDEEFTFGRSYGIKFPDEPLSDDALFAGWYYDEAGTQGPVDSFTTVEKASEHILYAKWRPAKFLFDFEDADDYLTGIIDSLSVGLKYSRVEMPAGSGNYMLKIDNGNAVRYSAGWVFSTMFTNLKIKAGDTLSFDYQTEATTDNPTGEFRFRALGPSASFLPGFTGGDTAGAAPPTTTESLATPTKKHVDIRMPVDTNYFRIEWWSTYTFGSSVNSAVKVPHCILYIDNIVITPAA